jgi:hypothetical protein
MRCRRRHRKAWKQEVEREVQVLGVRRWRYGDRQEKMKGDCLTRQSLERAVVPVEEEESVY